MPDGKQKIQEPQSIRLPIAAIFWAIITIITFFVSQQTVTLQDEERFPSDFELLSEPNELVNTIQAGIVNGTFEYGITPEEQVDVETGVYTDESNYPVARALFDNIPDLTEVVINEQTIVITYDNDNEADLMLQRAQRPLNNSVLNDNNTISSDVLSADEKQLQFTTSDEIWYYGEYVPQLIADGQEEVYASREAGEAGSELSQFLFANVSQLEALTITPNSLIAIYRDGAVENQVVNRLTDALNDFYPRASLLPNLWVMNITFDSATILNIVPINTGIPLFFFVLVFALIEAGLFYYLRDTDDKLIRPLVRVLGIFLFFWSIFGHEPLWDFMLSQIFPTSLQLVHPNATVIEFVAQHLELVIVSSLITIPVGLVFGILVTRDNFRELLPLVNNLVNSGQTVPTIAIVAFMAPIIGFGFWPAIIALIAYGLLPVLRNTIAGLEAVDDFVIDSARGMGMTPSQILLQIELPIASSVIMAGIRTSMVINVGTATLGAFVGSGGLGTPIASGLAMTVDSFILLGAIPAAILAILIDYVLGRIEYVFTPRGLQIET